MLKGTDRSQRRLPAAAADHEAAFHMATPTLCQTYSGESAARAAARALRHADVPADGIIVLTGGRLRDRRDEPAGTFAGLASPDASVGTYAGTRHPRRAGAGSFAGDPDRQRQGTFADTDSVVLCTFRNGAERSRVTGDRALRRLLRGTPIDGDTVDRVARELREGHAVVLAEVPPKRRPGAAPELQASRVSTAAGQPQPRRMRSVAKTRMSASALGVQPYEPSSERGRHA
jgi:hypothetical protein